ncbi:MAG: hypothetical protein ACJ77N_10295 [Chloroflexota bacterium]|jgi:hypothetical protein
MTQSATTPTSPSLLLLDEPPATEQDAAPPDPGELLLTCASCGARMEDRRCKLICRCGYFLSCSDYL